jgi:hypothetical protein
MTGTFRIGARGGVVGEGTMLQAGMPRVRFPIRITSLGSTQPLTEMSTTNLPAGKGRPARKADNRLSRKCVNLDASQLYGPPPHLTGIALSFYLFIFECEYGSLYRQHLRSAPFDVFHFHTYKTGRFF